MSKIWLRPDLDEWEVVDTCSREQAIADGTLIEILKDRWDEISGGKPIIATSAVLADFQPDQLLSVWEGYLMWKEFELPTLPEEEQLFTTRPMGRLIWVVEDRDAYTIMYPGDY
jgi:hypothetical protein